MNDSILFTTLTTASGHLFGRATLNAPASLNALTLEMIDLLGPQLDAWAADPNVAGVMLDGAGEKGFCAGGDVVAQCHAIRRVGPGNVPPEAEAFFEREYRLDCRIHTYPKPLLCWGHGIVMGGGVGLLAAASHRVVTPRTKLAMPEITIGLYPDVGGSWFMGRMPGRTGIFFAVTGAPMNAADARFAGLADFTLRHEEHAAVLEAIAASRWAGDRTPDATQLSHLLERYGNEAALMQPPMPSPLRTHYDRIAAVMGHDEMADIAPRLAALTNDPDPWLAQAGTTFVKGSPTSAAISFDLQQRARHMSLADVFRLEYQASIGFCVHNDFAEGVRALLVDKDKRPQWQPATLGEVSREFIEAHYVKRFEGAHPLADL